MSRPNQKTLLTRIETIAHVAVGIIIGASSAAMFYEVKNFNEAPPQSQQIEEKETDMYEYQAKVIRVVDADTLWCRVDLGFRLYREISLRFADINAPELSTQEGKDARDRLKEVLLPDSVIVVRTFRDPGAYDRYTATVLYNGTNMNQWLVENGYAVPYQYKD